MRPSRCCRAVQSIFNDVQAAAECRTVIATSSFAQRRTFLMALHDELRRNRDVIIRANRRDCDVFGQQQQQRGTPSVTVPPTMPSAAAAASLPATSFAAGAAWSSYPPAPLLQNRERRRAAEAASNASRPAASGSAAGRADVLRRQASLDYVANTALVGSAEAAESAPPAGTFSAAANAAAAAAATPGGQHVGDSEGGAALTGIHPNSSSSQSNDSNSSGSSSRRRREGDTGNSAAAESHSGGSATARASDSRARRTAASVKHTEAGGGGGHLLYTADHHLLISPLRLDKLHATIDYLLCQPDPIAVPPSCWLHQYAERGSGDFRTSAKPASRGSGAARAADHGRAHDDDDPFKPFRDVSHTAADAAAPRPTYLRSGQCTRRTEQLEVYELPVPLGMIGILSRFRPRIGLDAVAMGLFAGNTVLVDGGVSLYYTNMALMTVVRRALTAAGLPASAVVCVESYDSAHRTTSEWLQLSEHVDLAVVCGPPKLYHFAARHATVPLMRATGQFSSIYVDQSASFEVALEVIVNSKFQKFGAANAVTTAILHRDFPRYTELLMALAANGAVLLGDAVAQERVPDCVSELASEEEYQGLSQFGLRDAARTLCIKTVDTLAQALFFVESYGSKQSDCVVATDPEVCAAYCRQVDTAVALVNASTRLSSGVPLGCGVDFAISTSKAHCRGPLTLNMMTTRKLVARSPSVHRAALR